MTESQKKGLLELFTASSLSEINSSPNNILKAVGVQEPEQLSAIEGYGAYYKMMSDIVWEIESIKGTASQEEQTKRAIQLLGDKVKKVNNDAVAATDKLIGFVLFNQWSHENQQRYTTGKQLLLDWVHFFISYTNSSTPAINNTYKSLLKSRLGVEYLNANKEKMNLIAALLYKFFNTQRVSTFYDKEKIDWGDEWKDKIFSYSAKSFAFVQFIEPDIFYGTSDKNYCYKEYVSYTKSVSKLTEDKLQEVKPVYFFIISNPARTQDYEFKPANLDEAAPELGKWADEVKGKQYFTLHSKMTDDELLIEIQKAARAIVEKKKSVIEQFLNSF